MNRKEKFLLIFTLTLMNFSLFLASYGGYLLWINIHILLSTNFLFGFLVSVYVALTGFLYLGVLSLDYLTYRKGLNEFLLKLRE